MLDSCDVDVLIVGGGPAGLATAQKLAPHHSVLVVHQDNDIGKPVRTSGGSWLADAQALGIPPALYSVMDEIQFASAKTDVVRYMAHHKMVVLDVTGTYQWLADQARSAGARIETRAKFLSAAQITDKGAQSYRSHIRTRNGEKTVTSRYIVDASGYKCAVLENFGYARAPQRVGVGYEMEFEIKSAPLNRAVLIVGEQVKTGYGWIFPAPNNHIRIGMGIMQPDTDLSPRAIYDAVVDPAFLSRFSLELGPHIQTNAGTIPAVAYDPKLVFGNVIRVGDSANVATPTVGEGIRIAINTGHQLGCALRDTLANPKSGALRAYERTCTRNFKMNYRAGFSANKRLASYDDAQWERSLSRISRLSEDEFAGLIRSEFSPKMVLKAGGKFLWHKLRKNRAR